jgi:glyoxylase-like metal-dependent hydrolase (beta-lactamase superfamily II)
MVHKIFEGLYAFIWQDYRQNNCNSYLIDDGKKILIDPGHSHLFNHVEQGLASLRIEHSSIDLIIITHAHPDHMEAAFHFSKPTQIAIGKKDYDYLKTYAGSYYTIPEPDLLLASGDLTVGNLQFRIIDTPGHTPGSICVYWPKQQALFTGDVIFDQGIGRTDLPGGDGKALKESIQKISTLETQYLLSGHGSVVAGKQAVQNNFKQVEDYWFRYL